MIELNQALARLPLVAILRGIEPEEVEGVAEALVGAGFVLIEVPLNTPQALRSIGILSEGFGETALVGAGTIRCLEDLDAVRGAGGRLGVMPHTQPGLIQRALEIGLAPIPGVLSPSEAFAAVQAGATALKVFPAQIAGPTGVGALRVVLPPEVALLPVGGVGVEDVGPYLRAGATGFGLGGGVYRPGRPPAEVSVCAAAYVQALEQARG